jgi:hypothetical protein
MKHFSTWFAVAVVGLPLVYLLAGGPITFMYERRWISFQTAARIGAPVNWAGDHGWLQTSGIERPLAAYYSWWSRCAH